VAGLPPRELAAVAEVTPLTETERALVASWSAPESYQATPTIPAAASTSSRPANGSASPSSSPWPGPSTVSTTLTRSSSHFLGGLRRTPGCCLV